MSTYNNEWREGVTQTLNLKYLLPPSVHFTLFRAFMCYVRLKQMNADSVCSGCSNLLHLFNHKQPIKNPLISNIWKKFL